MGKQQDGKERAVCSVFETWGPAALTGYTSCCGD